MSANDTLTLDMTNRVLAESSGKVHALEKENRLLRAAIEQLTAQLVAMDATLEAGDTGVVRAMAKDVEEIGRLLQPFETASTIRHRDTVMPPREVIDRLARISKDWRLKIEHHQLGTQCDEPGCVLRNPLHKYAHHRHTDGFRQWVTHSNGRRYKRGSW